MNNPIVNKNIFLLEAVAEFRENLLNNTNFEKVAQEHIISICNEDDEARQEQIMSMAKMFGNMLDLMGDKEYEQINL